MTQLCGGMAKGVDAMSQRVEVQLLGSKPSERENCQPPTAKSLQWGPGHETDGEEGEGDGVRETLEGVQIGVGGEGRRRPRDGRGEPPPSKSRMAGLSKRTIK